MAALSSVTAALAPVAAPVRRATPAAAAAPLAARRSVVGLRSAAPAGRARAAGSVDVRCQAAPAKAAAPAVSEELVNKSINAIRFLAIDGVEKANSGHPGLPMGCAPMTYVVFREAMKFNPKNPAWFNRDRFVLSAGHGSMLQYAMLHLCGYDSVKVRPHSPQSTPGCQHAGCPPLALQAARPRCWVTWLLRQAPRCCVQARRPCLTRAFPVGGPVG